MSAATQTPPRGLDAMRARAANGQIAAPAARVNPIAQPPMAPETALPAISIGFGDLASWEFTQRVARALASSTMVPLAYRMYVPNPRRREEVIENPNAIPNCIVALSMAKRLQADPLMVMQNLHMIEGRPSWAATFVISMVNNSKIFGTRLQFEFSEIGERTVECVSWEWSEQERRKVQITKKIPIHDRRCVAWTIDPVTNERVEGPEVSIGLAVQEGWYTKNGSKWRTMPSIMLMYRAAAFFCRVHTPELMMGLRTQDEAMDILEAEIGADGSWQVPPQEAGQTPEGAETPEAGGAAAAAAQNAVSGADGTNGNEEEGAGEEEGREEGGRQTDAEERLPPETHKKARQQGSPPRVRTASVESTSTTRANPGQQLNLDDGFGSIE